MNLDVAACVLVAAALAALSWALWRAAGGRARSRVRAAVRVGVSLVLALVLVGGGTYWLMNSRTVQLAGDHVARVETARKVVALTFDDGPDEAYVDGLLADLRRYDARATFYVIGAAAAEQPAALRELVAAGEEIGNHTYHHRRLVFVSTATAGEEVTTTDAAIRAAGYGGPITVRPPYAKKLVSLPYWLASHGRTTVMWDLEPDSMSGLWADAQAMTRYVTGNVRPGAIVELHPWAPGNAASREAVPLILAALQAKGYEFVTVSELLALR